MQETTLRAARRIVLVGLVAGPVLGAGVGAATSINEPWGLWVFGLVVGGVVGVPLGLLTSALSAAVVLTHTAARNPQAVARGSGVPLGWHLLVPLPATALTAWWVVDSPVLALGFRVAVTAAATVIGSAWVLWTARWVMAPLTASSTADLRPSAPPLAPS